MWSTLALTALVFSTAGAGDTAAEWRDLPTLVERLETPRLIGRDISDEMTLFSIGDLELDLSGGSVFPVAAGDRTVGFFFLGRGRARFAPADSISASVFDLNVRRATPFKLTDGALQVPLEAALVLDSRMRETPAPEAAEAPAEVARAFTRHLERFSKDRLVDPPNQIAQAMIDDAGGPVVMARLATNRDDLLYRYDELSLGAEALYRMQRYPSDSALRGQRFPSYIASRPLDGDWLDPAPPRFVLRHVDLDLRNRHDPAMELIVEERLEILQPLETLELSLWSEVFHERKRFELVLDSVTLVSGDGESELPFSHRNGDLVVQLPEVVAAGEEVTLRFRTHGDLLHRPSRNSYWWLPIGSWLPLPPRFDMRSFTLRADACVAPPFVPFGMGTTVRRWEEEGASCLEFELTEPVQFAVVLAGSYHSYSETRDGQTITLSSYAFAQDEPMKPIAENLFELIDWYEERLGEFPYPELNIVEIKSYGFGIGPPGVIYLTQEGFDPGPVGRSFRKQINMRMAHEVAHMWWGHVAQMESPDDQWLSESTAEYFAALAVDALVERDGFRDAERDWKAEAGNSKAAPSIYLANHLAGERGPFDRRNLLYGRGPLMLQALREEIGDEAFFTVMRRFVDENRHRHVSTGQFIELVNEVSGRDLRPWFERELFGLD